MQARLLSTQGFGLEAVIEIKGQELHVMDRFSPDTRQGTAPRTELDVALSALLDDDETWEAIFTGNPSRRYGLERIEGWRYRAFGRVEGINPVRVDCGVYVQEEVIQTNDPRVVGEFVSFLITRLDASSNDLQPQSSD